MEEVRVVKQRRISPAARRKRRRVYLKKKSAIKRKQARYRKKASSKRLAKRRAKIKKRMHIKSGSRKRVYVSDIEVGMEKHQRIMNEVKELNDYVSRSYCENMVEAFSSAKILAGNILTVLKERKEKEVVWLRGPNTDGVYEAEFQGKKKTFNDRIELAHYEREMLGKGLSVLWKQYDEQTKYELGESVQLVGALDPELSLPDFEMEESLSDGEQYIQGLLEDGETKQEKPVEDEGLEEPKPVDVTPIIKDIEEVVSISKKTISMLKNESIDEFEAHQLLIKVSEYLDKAAVKFIEGK